MEDDPSKEGGGGQKNIYAKLKMKKEKLFSFQFVQKCIVLGIFISSGAKDRSEKVVRNCPHERIVKDIISCNISMCLVLLAGPT